MWLEPQCYLGGRGGRITEAYWSASLARKKKKKEKTKNKKQNPKQQQSQKILG
jgi:hypothetical protein